MSGEAVDLRCRLIASRHVLSWQVLQPNGLSSDRSPTLRSTVIPDSNCFDQHSLLIQPNETTSLHATDPLATQVYVEYNDFWFIVCVKACNETAGRYAGTSWPAPSTFKNDSLPAVLNIPYFTPLTLYDTNDCELKVVDSGNVS
jgi:hypothetical protein